MYGFFIALQFLTRIRVFEQKKWADDDFSRSVPWFPLVGAVVGLLLFFLAMFLSFCDGFLRAVILLTAELFIAGPTLTDGLMDTADGVFSGRGRERMLEIMKDSHVGANAVIAFVLAALLKVAVYQALSGELLLWSLFAMPVVSKFAVVIAVTRFPYARAQGIGKLFTEYTDKNYVYKAALLTAMLLTPSFSLLIAAAATVALLLGILTARYLTGVLGGLTGDTYGFIGETCGLMFLLFIYGFSYINA